jgi:hypothetical protein
LNQKRDVLTMRAQGWAAAAARKSSSRIFLIGIMSCASWGVVCEEIG